MLQPRSASPCANAAMRAGASGSSAARFMSTPMRRIRSACCARAASGHAAAAPPRSAIKSRRFTDARWLHRLFLRFRLVATGPDNFGNGAVPRAEFQHALAGVGNYRTTVGLDFRDIAVAILDFDAPMVDARTGARKLRLFDIFAVVDHQGQIDVSVC